MKNAEMSDKEALPAPRRPILRKPVFAVAPMLDWTDRHCRYFYRQFSKRALLYTEMAVDDAVIHGRREKILGFSREEHPVALQLGGSDPQKLAEAARIAEDFGYDEINLNIGCPSDRVRAGAFGACLMLEPQKVARAVEAMKKAVRLPISIKCRIGVAEADKCSETRRVPLSEGLAPREARRRQETPLSEARQGTEIRHEADERRPACARQGANEKAADERAGLAAFAPPVWEAGADGFWIHARKVWLNGLSPKENRTVPPLDYQCAYRFKQNYADKFVGINGGIATIEEAKAHLRSMDGIMLGRAVYHNPALLAEVDSAIYGEPPRQLDYQAVIDAMAAYCDRHIAEGGALLQVSRHMIGLFHGVKGAKAWRQILSTQANERNADSSVLYRAFAQIDFSAAEENETAA